MMMILIDEAMRAIIMNEGIELNGCARSVSTLATCEGFKAPSRSLENINHRTKDVFSTCLISKYDVRKCVDSDEKQSRCIIVIPLTLPGTLPALTVTEGTPLAFSIQPSRA